MKDLMIETLAVLVVALCFFPFGEKKAKPAEVQPEPTVVETTTEETTTQIELQEFIVTAYCPCEKCCGKWAKNRKGSPRGASGALLVSGKSVAVDTKTIPYGSVVVIEGKEYIAHDCGGKVKGNHIDIYFDTHEEAVKFGKQTLKGYVKK